MDRMVSELLGVISTPERIAELHGVLGSFCHQWRNHLNAIKLGLHVARRSRTDIDREFWDQMDRRYLGLERFIGDLQDICRPMRLSPLRLPLDAFWTDRHQHWQPEFARLGRAFELCPPPEPVHADFDPTRFVRVFDTLALGRVGPGPIRVRWWEESNAMVHVEWHEPEGSIQPQLSCDQPASLALPVLGRLLTSHGGRLEVREHGQHGFSLGMSWPTTWALHHASP